MKKHFRFLFSFDSGRINLNRVQLLCRAQFIDNSSRTSFGIRSETYRTQLQLRRDLLSCSIKRNRVWVDIQVRLKKLRPDYPETSKHRLNLFEKISTTHSYHTWSSTSGNFHIKSSKLEIPKKTPCLLLALNFGMRYLVRDLPKKEFMKVLHRLRFAILQTEEDYIEMSLITGNVGLTVKWFLYKIMFFAICQFLFRFSLEFM